MGRCLHQPKFKGSWNEKIYVFKKYIYHVDDKTVILFFIIFYEDQEGTLYVHMYYVYNLYGVCVCVYIQK